MKKSIITIIVLFAIFQSTAWAVTVFNSNQTGYSPSAGYILQTNGATSTWVATSSLGIIGTSQWINSGSGIYYNAGNVSIGLATTSYLLDVRDGTDPTSLNLTVDNTSNTIGLTANGGGILLNPNNPESYVGVGTPLPQSAFEVSNTVQTASLLRVDNANNFVGLGTVASNDPDEFEGIRVGFPVSASYPYIKIGSPGYTGNGTLLTVDDYNAKFTFINGNVGIGTTSPDRPLTFARATGEKVSLYSVSATARNYYGFAVEDDTLALQVPNGKDIKFYDATSENMIIKGSGNVGIGTTSPSAKLAITGTAGTGDIFAISSSTNTRLLTVTAAGNVGVGTAVPITKLSLGLSTENSDSSKIALWEHPSNSDFYGMGLTYYGTQFGVGTFANGKTTPKMVVQGNGNVGIGTTAPGAKLQVTGTTYLSGPGDTVLTFDSSAGNYKTVFSNANGLNIGNSASIGTAGTARVTIQDGGNVGIGTTGPATRLDLGTYITSGATPSATLSNYQLGFGIRDNVTGNLSNNIAFYGSSGTTIGAYISGYDDGTSSASGLSFGTKSGVAAVQEKMRIDSNGNVGIGTTTPQSRLVVSDGDIYVASSTRGIILKDTVSGCYRYQSTSGVLVGTSVTCPE